MEEQQFTQQELRIIAQALSQMTVRVNEAPTLLAIIQKAAALAEEFDDKEE